VTATIPGATYDRPEDGELVTVYYDSDDPDRATLDPGPWSFSHQVCVISVAVLGLVAIRALISATD
jgi:hypothetical protein